MVFFTSMWWPQGTRPACPVIPAIPVILAKWGMQVRCRPSLPRAGVQDDSSLHKFPQTSMSWHQGILSLGNFPDFLSRNGIFYKQVVASGNSVVGSFSGFLFPKWYFLQTSRGLRELKSWPLGIRPVIPAIPAIPVIPAIPAKWGGQVRCRPSLPRARVQDDGSSHKLLQIRPWSAPWPAIVSALGGHFLGRPRGPVVFFILWDFKIQLSKSSKSLPNVFQ